MSYFDAIAIGETKIYLHANDSHLALDGSNFFHVDREERGVAALAFTPATPSALKF